MCKLLPHLPGSPFYLGVKDLNEEMVRPKADCEISPKLGIQRLSSAGPYSPDVFDMLILTLVSVKYTYKFGADVFVLISSAACQHLAYIPPNKITFTTLTSREQSSPHNKENPQTRYK